MCTSRHNLEMNRCSSALSGPFLRRRIMRETFAWLRGVTSFVDCHTYAWNMLLHRTMASHNCMLPHSSILSLQAQVTNHGNSGPRRPNSVWRTKWCDMVNPAERARVLIMARRYSASTEKIARCPWSTAGTISGYPPCNFLLNHYLLTVGTYNTKIVTYRSGECQVENLTINRSTVFLISMISLWLHYIIFCIKLQNAAFHHKLTHDP